MSDAENTISPEGKEKAEQELRSLQEVRRPEIVAMIKTARAEGDLSENAEYHAARERLGHLEARVRYLEHHLQTAEVSEGGGADIVGVGSTVSYRDGDQTREVTLVNPLEVDVAAGKISAKSAVAQALLGASAGDRVTAETRGGEKQLEVLSVG